MQQEIDLNSEIIQDRHEELLEMSKTVNTVNVLMRDLAKMVDEQNASIRAITKNIDTAKDIVNRSYDEVKKAEKYQQEGEYKCIIS